MQFFLYSKSEYEPNNSEFLLFGIRIRYSTHAWSRVHIFLIDISLEDLSRAFQIFIKTASHQPFADSLKIKIRYYKKI